MSEPPRIPRLIVEVDRVEWHSGPYQGWKEGLRSARVEDLVLPWMGMESDGNEARGDFLALDANNRTVLCKGGILKRWYAGHDDRAYCEIALTGPVELI